MEQDNQNEKVTVTDNMQLSLFPFPEVPEDVIFPDELNAYLRDRVQYLTYENGMLKKNLFETEERLQESCLEIENLKRKITEFNNNKSSYQTASNVTSEKIVELSKKLREKNAEVEVLKTKSSKLEKIINELNEKYAGGDIQNNVALQKIERPENELEEQIKVLQEKLNCANSKLFETKNINLQLKNDLKLANKFLQQEIGESFDTLQSLSNSSSNWRGRAQIICDLQQKNSELREKLKQKGLQCTSTEPVPRTDKRVDILNKENADLRQALEDMKRKLQAAKARCKTLETECCSVKSKLIATAEQNDKDHELVTTLMAKISSAREEQNEIGRQKEKLIKLLQQENNQLTIELEKEKCLNENLKKSAGSSHELTSQIKCAQNCQAVDDETEKNLARLKTEKARLLELTENLQKKLEKEREDHARTQCQYRAERQRAAKFEAKVARLQLENSDAGSTSGTYSTMSGKRANTSLQDQLELAEESIKALQTRLEIEKQERKLDFQEFSKILQSFENPV